MNTGNTERQQQLVEYQTQVLCLRSRTSICPLLEVEVPCTQDLLTFFNFFALTLVIEPGTC